MCIDRLTFPSKKQGKFNAPILSRTFPIPSVVTLSVWKEWQVVIQSKFSSTIKLYSHVRKMHTHTHWGRDILECTHCLLLFFSGLKSGKFGSSFSLQNPLWRLKDTITIRNLLVGKACNNHKCFFFPWQINWIHQLVYFFPKGYKRVFVEGFILPKYWIFFIKKKLQILHQVAHNLEGCSNF